MQTAISFYQIFVGLDVMYYIVHKLHFNNCHY